MWKTRFIMILALAAIVLSGCAVFGRGKDHKPFDPDALQQVKPGVTTAAEVTRLFGPPNRIVKLANGNAYTYERSVDKTTGLWLVVLTFANWDKQFDRVVFFIDRQDVVTHYGSSFQAESAEYGMPF
jgi:predicted component of type VI protein secretion system